MADKARPASPDHNIVLYVPASSPQGSTNVVAPHHLRHRLPSVVNHGGGGGGSLVSYTRAPPPFVAYRTYENTSRTLEPVVSCEQVESIVSSNSICPPPPSTHHELSNSSSDSIAPPYGWKRILSKGVIVYISPSNATLSSTDQVKTYLLTDGTCKCGLECPVNCDIAFNFNPKVLTKPWTVPVVTPGELTKLCNHKRKHIPSSPLEIGDSHFGGIRRKKRRLTTSQLLPPVEKLIKDQQQQPFNGIQSVREVSAPAVPRLRVLGGGPGSCPAGDVATYRRPDSHNLVHPPPTFNRRLGALSASSQTPLDAKPSPLTDGSQLPAPSELRRSAYIPYEFDYAKNLGLGEAVLAEGKMTAITLAPSSRLPPWQQNKQPGPEVGFDRVPPVHSYESTTLWSPDRKKCLPNKLARRKCADEEPAHHLINQGRSLVDEQPSFMDDPSGYLAQQTALLNSTISRQNNPLSANIAVQLTSGIHKYGGARSKLSYASRVPDSSFEKRKIEEPSSTLQDQCSDGPIQGSTVSTSHRSPVDVSNASYGTETAITTIVTTMASGHTVSSNTITSVLAGRANTATVSVNNQSGAQKSGARSEGGRPPHEHQAHLPPTKTGSAQQHHILVSSNGQLIVANSSMLSPQQAGGGGGLQKMSSTSPSGPSSSIGLSQQVLNQPAVLVNSVSAPLLLQQGVTMVDGLNSVQIPQLVRNVVPSPVLDEGGMLSPHSKKKHSGTLKKRKLSPTMSSALLLSPQGTNSVVVQQPQTLNPGSMLQALTILPSKGGFGGAQQLITANMLQPLNLVQNFPIQQFLVPAGVSGMVMSDGTILQDAVQLNVLTPMQNAGVFGNNQNLIGPGMVIRAPNNQPANKVIHDNQFMGSTNQFMVNNNFSGQLSPMLSVSPNQCCQNQDYVPQNVVVQQPSTSNTTVLQQNTTIVQQTTTVSNQPTHPTSTLNLNQNLILNEKPNFILTSEKQNFILSPNNDNFQGNYVLSNVEKRNLATHSGLVNSRHLVGVSRGGGADKKNSVSTQTLNQVLQISSSPAALLVATNTTPSSSSSSSSSCFSASPPDTTTLSPIDHEVTTSSLHRGPISPGDHFSLSSQSCPMVNCISSSSQQEDSPPFSIDPYSSPVGKSYSPPSEREIVMNEVDGGKLEYGLCNVPDSLLASNESNFSLNEEP